MRDSFREYHPIVNLIYFVLVIAFSLVLNHPLAQVISLAGAVCYALSTDGKRTLLKLVKFGLPMALVTAIINPLFNHEGKTVLFYLTEKSPVSAESLLYGLSAGVMLITLLVWFSSFSRVMTTDKLTYLFGKSIPAISLVLTMSLRLVPRFTEHMKEVADAQRCLGKYVSSGTLMQKTKAAIHVFSITVTWALENAMDAADSMKSRGYGLRGRTTFSIYKFADRDKYAVIWFSFCGMFLTAGAMLSAFGFLYFPEIRYAAFDKTTVPFYCVLLLLCLTPVLLNLKEERKWKSLISEA